MIQEISDLVSRISPSSGGVYESARLNDNLDGTGGITVSWNSATAVTLPIGESLVYGGTKYSLLEPYSPSKASAIPHYRYEVTFQHPLARLSRVPFYIESQYLDTDDNGVVQHVGIQLHTVPYTGLARTIVAKLAGFFAEYGIIDEEFGTTFGEWSYDIPASLAGTVITVEFDGCSIRTAATRIADACGCNVFFDWATKTIRFIVGSTIDGESYNCFRVLGGTTNMAKRNVSGMFSAVTQRLTLPETYKGSIIDKSEGGIRLTTDLILDNIYPKMELFVASAMERLCYLTDDDGKQIPDGNGGYKLYSKWYVRLRYADGTPYSHDVSFQIADKPLAILFQPTYGEAETSPLAGRQFEVVYFSGDTEEWEEDDVSETPTQVPAGWFRIVFSTEGDAILPTTAASGLIPKTGNKVSLVNMAVESMTKGGKTYRQIAQEQLAKEAEDIIEAMMADSGEYSTEIVGNIPTIGSEYTIDGHKGIVTTVNADLDTGMATVTVGSWKRKTLTGSMRDKIDSVTSKTSGETSEGERGLPKSQFDALWKTTKKPSIDMNLINALGADIAAVKQQTDARFYYIFGVGVPTNDNEPAKTWISEGTEELHLQDIYYNTQREGASQGGRAYRWMKVGTVSGSVVLSDGKPVEYNAAVHDGYAYMWEQITDMDTNASLERIADVASDAIITGGAEKTRVYLEWKNAAEQYSKTISEARDFNVSTTAFKNSYWVLWNFLDGKEGALNSVAMRNVAGEYNDIPAWITDLSEDTNLGDYGRTADDYRSVWDSFYTQLATITNAMTGENRTIITTKTAYFVSASVPTPPYNINDMWLKLSNANATTGDLYRCNNYRETGVSGYESDWELVQQFGVSITSMLADLAVKLEDISWVQDKDVIPIIFSGTNTHSSSTITYCYRYDTLYIGNDADGNNDLKRLLFEIYGITGEDSITLYRQSPSAGDTVGKYDILAYRSSFRDNFTGKVIDGSLGVWVYDGSVWIKVLDNSTGIMQNYGDALFHAIFGDDVTPDGKTSYASGLVTTKNMSSLFTQAVQEDVNGGKKTVMAAISTMIEYDVFGNPTGRIKLSADNIDFSSTNFRLSAAKIDFNGQDLDLSVANSINLNAKSVSLNASLVNFVNQEILIKSTSFNIDADSEFNISSGKSLTLNSQGNLELSGGTVNITGDAAVNITGGTLSLAGTDVILNASSSLDISSGEALTISGGHLNLSGTEINVQSNSSLNLTAATIALNADQITWKGMNVIPGSKTTDPSKFAVDNDGNVTMNNATINGTITAVSGYIGGTNGWKIDATKLSNGTIGSKNSMYLATEDLDSDVRVAGESLSTWRFTVGSKFGVTSDGLLFADGATITNINASGSITLPSDTGTFTYSKSNVFGLFMDSSAVFDSPRIDYYYGYQGRGAILRIEHYNNLGNKSFRGIFCAGDAEFQGVTQLLRKNGSAESYSLIVEGIDNKEVTCTAGLVNKGKNVRNIRSSSQATVTVTDSDEILFLTSTSQQTVYFPSTAEEGRQLWIRNTAGSTRISASNLNGSNPESISATNRWHVYIYCAGTWYYGYSN